MTSDPLPDGYPFVPEDKAYPVVLDGAQWMIYHNARDNALRRLRLDHFNRVDPDVAEHEHLNDELATLGQTVIDAAALLEQPGPWNGLTPDTDVPLAAAEIQALLIELSVPLTGAEAALTAAITAAEDDIDPRSGRHWRAQQALRNQVLADLNAAEGTGKPLQDRLNALDRLTATVQRYRDDLATQHEHTAADNPDPGPGNQTPRLTRRQVSDLAEHMATTLTPAMRTETPDRFTTALWFAAKAVRQVANLLPAADGESTAVTGRGRATLFADIVACTDNIRRAIHTQQADETPIAELARHTEKNVAAGLGWGLILEEAAVQVTLPDVQTNVQVTLTKTPDGTWSWNTDDLPLPSAPSPDTTTSNCTPCSAPSTP